MSEKIRVLVVDDSSFMRNMLSRLLERDGRFEIVGKAENGEKGVELAKSTSPDVITMDIEMPKMNGIEALKIIMKDKPTPVVMVSSLTKEGANATLDAMDHGAVDFIPKSMESGGGSVLNNSSVLMDKIYAASKARILGAVKTKPITKPVNKSISKSEVKVSKTVIRNNVEEKVIPKPRVNSILVNKNLNAKVFIIGSSTGGPRALQDVIPHLPANIRIPTVIAQHMPANFTGQMADRLNSISNINVVEGKDGDILKAGFVYIAPGGKHSRVENKNGSLILSVKEDAGGECVYKPSVDILAESASKSVGGNALALMLTGMGADGSKGFKKLKQNGGYILSQDRETSVVYGMPKAVANFSDEIIPLNDISNVITRLIG